MKYARMQAFAAKQGIVLPVVVFHDSGKGWRNTGHFG